MLLQVLRLICRVANILLRGSGNRTVTDAECGIGGDGGGGGGGGGGGVSNSGDDGSGGGFWQNDDDGMDVGGRFTSTPGAEGLSGAMEQDFDPRRADGGGAAEEMDRNGAVELTSGQKRHARRQRAKQRPQASD